MIYLIESISIQ